MQVRTLFLQFRFNEIVLGGPRHRGGHRVRGLRARRELLRRERPVQLRKSRGRVRQDLQEEAARVAAEELRHLHEGLLGKVSSTALQYTDDQ